ncbi:hypothetical protein ACJMK2_012512 [Sinanodonta woodiana]|uniref:Uncharacterized protein n=1 Tax=Sinanodonta woodiana TaxID=1069815 RepID=A0ABD3VAE2_SINWO
MRNRTTTSRGRRKRRGSEIVDLRQVINRKRQTTLRTNEHVDNSETLESSGNKEEAKDISELSSIRPKIDYSDILVSSADMTKDEANTDFSSDVCERIRQSMFMKDEMLQISDDNEASNTNVSDCSGNREIPTKNYDDHRSRQVHENELSITSRKYVATHTSQDEHIHEQSDLNSIPLHRRCNSNKDEGSDVDREIIGSDETREEGEIYEDEYVHKQPIQDFSSLRKYDHDAFGFKSKKRSELEVKEERRSKQRRDNEAQNVNYSKCPHFLQLSAEKEVSARNVSYSKGKTDISNKRLVNSDCHRSDQGNVPSKPFQNYDHVTTDGHTAKETIHELGDLKSISPDTTRIADDSLSAAREKTASSELREEGEIYEDVQTQPKKLIKTVQFDDDVVNVRSRKRRRTDSKNVRGSKRRRDSEAQYVKNSRPHLQLKTNVSDRRRYTDASDQRSPRPLHRHHQRDKYSNTYPRTNQERNVFIRDSLDQNQTYVEGSSFLRTERNSGRSTSPVHKYDRRRDPPSPLSSISSQGRKQNRDKSRFVQRRDKRGQISGERGNESRWFRDLNNKSLDEDKGTFDFTSESKNYGRDIYRRNREQSSWECPSRNKSNISAAHHKQNEDYGTLRHVYDSRLNKLNEEL